MLSHLRKISYHPVTLTVICSAFLVTVFWPGSLSAERVPFAVSSQFIVEPNNVDKGNTLMDSIAKVQSVKIGMSVRREKTAL